MSNAEAQDELRSVLRQMLTDWNAATPEQRAVANEAADTAATAAQERIDQTTRDRNDFLRALDVPSLGYEKARVNFIRSGSSEDEADQMATDLQRLVDTGRVEDTTGEWAHLGGK